MSNLIIGSPAISAALQPLHADELAEWAWPAAASSAFGSVGVYVAAGTRGECLYVGSVWRPGDPRGMRSRLDDHRRRNPHSQSWARLAVALLPQETPLEEVRRAEGRVSLYLAPTFSMRWPRL